MTQHILSLKVCKDAHNLGSTSMHDIGTVGNFCQPVIRRQCGQSRQFYVELSDTSPFQSAILGLAIQVELDE